MRSEVQSGWVVLTTLESYGQSITNQYGLEMKTRKEVSNHNKEILESSIVKEYVKKE